MTETLESIAREMLAYEAEQFDPPAVCRGLNPGLCPGVAACTACETPDLSVSGADLVDAFTGWRERLKAALASPSAKGTRRKRKGVRLVKESRIVSAPVLAALVSAAEAYADDLESGLAEGLYDDPADLDAVRTSLDIVAPKPCTPAERKAATIAGYHVSSYGGTHYAWPPQGVRLSSGQQWIGTASTRSAALDVAARHMVARKGQLAPGLAAAGLAEAMGGPLATEAVAADRAGSAS